MDLALRIINIKIIMWNRRYSPLPGLKREEQKNIPKEGQATAFELHWTLAY